MCFGCSKEQSHRDGSFEYPQHMFLLKNKKNNFQLRTLIWGPEKIAIYHPFINLTEFLLVCLSVFPQDSDCVC